MSDPIDIAEGYSAEPYGDGYIICHSGGGRAVAQLDIAAAVREITRLRALAAQVPQPVAWLCEWIDPEDQSITWHQYHDASDPMPDKWVGDMCAGFGREIWARMLAASQESATTRGGVSRKR